MRKLTTAAAPFRIQVANLRQGSDPSLGASGNPQKLRSSFRTQQVYDIAGRGPEVSPSRPSMPGVGSSSGLLTFTVPGVSVPATGTVTVADNSFAGPTTLSLGSYTLTTDWDFAVGEDVATTASNLAAAIDLLPEYSAAAVLEVVTVSGPVGPGGNEVAFVAGGSSPSNFTLSPSTGTLSGAEPFLGPPELT